MKTRKNLDRLNRPHTEEDDELSVLLNETNTRYSTFDEPAPTTSSSYFGWVKSYIPSWRTINYTAAATLITLPFVPYAITDDPETIGLEWFAELSLGEQLYKALVAFVFTGVVITARYNYLPRMVNNLDEIFTNCYKSPANAVSCGIIVAASTVSAVPAAALGFKGAESLGYYLAVPAAISSYFSVFSLRIVFMDTFFKKVQRLFHEDRRFQEFLLHQIKHLNKEHRQTLSLLIKEQAHDRLLDENFIVEILESLRIELKKTNADTAFDAETACEQFNHYLKIACDSGLGLYFGLSLFLFMGEAGVMGIFAGQKILCDIFAENCELFDPAYTSKFIWTAITGFSSFIAALVTAFDVRLFLISLYQHVKDQPADIPKLLLITACAGSTSTVARNAAISILSKDSLLGSTLQNEPWLFQTILTGCYLVSLNFDSKPAFELCGLTNNTKPDAKNLLLYLEKNPLSENSITQLKGSGFFSKKLPKLLAHSPAKKNQEPGRILFCK